MDKLTQYKQIVGQLVAFVATLVPSDEQVETQVIADDKNGHYLLFSVGWNQYIREHAPFVHIDVQKEGKVWIQHDGTDLNLALMLTEKGVSKDDIILAFHHPARRLPLTEVL
jgi:XisI protein